MRRMSSEGQTRARATETIATSKDITLSFNREAKEHDLIGLPWFADATRDGISADNFTQRSGTLRSKPD